MTEPQNAIIKSVSIMIEDHGILTAFVFLEWPGGGAGLGGFAFDQAGPNRTRTPAKHLAYFVRRVLETVGVDAWEKLPGKPCRVIGELGESLQAIGHFMEDRWFRPAQELKELK